MISLEEGGDDASENASKDTLNTNGAEEGTVCSTTVMVVATAACPILAYFVSTVTIVSGAIGRPVAAARRRWDR